VGQRAALRAGLLLVEHEVSTKARSAKGLLEPRVVAYGGEVVVSARVITEPR
jgi:hypothetical protein